MSAVNAVVSSVEPSPEISVGVMVVPNMMVPRASRPSPAVNTPIVRPSEYSPSTYQACEKIAAPISKKKMPSIVPYPPSD